MNDQLQYLLFAVLAIAVVGSIVFLATRKGPRDAPWKPPSRYEIARIEERVSLSGGGGFSSVLLTLHNVIVAAVFLFGARSAIQEASLGTIWIAGNVLWGTCMMMGRRSIYVVTREEQPTEPSQS